MTITYQHCMHQSPAFFWKMSALTELKKIHLQNNDTKTAAYSHNAHACNLTLFVLNV